MVILNKLLFSLFSLIDTPLTDTLPLRILDPLCT